MEVIKVEKIPDRSDKSDHHPDIYKIGPADDPLISDSRERVFKNVDEVNKRQNTFISLEKWFH